MKPHITHILSMLTAIAMVLLFATCKQPATETTSETPAFNPAIAAFTSGTISGLARIRVVLAEDYPEVVAPNTPVGKKTVLRLPICPLELLKSSVKL